MEKKFHIPHLPRLLKQTWNEWNADDPFRLSAVVAYYAIFSLPALMLILLAVVSSIMDEQTIQQQVYGQITEMLGEQTSQSVKGMIENTRQSGKSLPMMIVGIGTLLFGATGAFYQLQISMNRVWNVRKKENIGMGKMVLDRVLSFGMILVIGFLFLISFILTTAISALSNWITSQLPEFTIYLFYAINLLLSFGLVTLLFALMFKYLPDVRIGWKSVWTGAAVTAILFLTGKFALSIYFGYSDPASTYGAAGSLILILLWVSYSCLILFFGAEFTQVYAREYGHPIEPAKYAVREPGKRSLAQTA